MLQNPPSQPDEHDHLGDRIRTAPIRADGKSRDENGERKLTKDEEHVITKLEVQAGLLGTIARKLNVGQLEIADARRVCIANSFITQALRELERGTSIAEPDGQIVFWE